MLIRNNVHIREVDDSRANMDAVKSYINCMKDECARSITRMLRNMNGYSIKKDRNLYTIEIDVFNHKDIVKYVADMKEIMKNCDEETKKAMVKAFNELNRSMTSENDTIENDCKKSDSNDGNNLIVQSESIANNEFITEVPLGGLVPTEASVPENPPPTNYVVDQPYSTTSNLTGNINEDFEIINRIAVTSDVTHEAPSI